MSETLLTVVNGTNGASPAGPIHAPDLAHWAVINQLSSARSNGSQLICDKMRSHSTMHKYGLEQFEGNFPRFALCSEICGIC